MYPKTVRWVGVLFALAVVSGPAHADHGGGAVILKSANGTAILAGSNVPYSPKATCGGCHVYESDATLVQKQQTVGSFVGAPYLVPVPTHGITTGFHFQQGLNVAWGDTQRSFYGQSGITSSPGMYGKL